MNILINAAGISATGPTQVTVSFLEECIKYPMNEYHVLLSNRLKSEINKCIFPINFTFYDIANHPVRSGIIKGWRVRNYLRNLENRIRPDVVFSVFGPSYWRPKKPHLQGYAQPHYIYPESPYFQKINYLQKMKWGLLSHLHMYYFLHCGNYFVCETGDVSERLSELYKVLHANVFVVSNTYGSNYLYSYPNDSLILPPKKENEFRFLSLCSYMTHKNLDIINHVASLMADRRVFQDFVFVLTIDDEKYQKYFSPLAKKCIINIGRISVDKCPQIYKECDALFLPTLLECFSANYPEAMVMQKPIITSNLSFARSVCGDAALYFNPLSASDILDKMSLLIYNADLRDELVKNGLKRLDSFSSSEQRAKRYLDICESIIRSN